MEVTSTKKEIWTMGSYSLLTLAIMVGFMYLNTFGTEVLKIQPGTLAAALGIAKFIDFIVSLLAGAIIEKVKIGSRGKNQEWLFVGRWILAVMILAEVFNTSAAPLMVRVAVIAVSYTVLNCLMNLIQTAYYGVLGAVAGPNMANRNAMSVNMTRQSTVIMLITSSIPTLVTVLPFGEWNYFIVALVFMLPMPITLGRIAHCADGKDLPVGRSETGRTITPGDMLGTLTKNPQMLAVFIGFTLNYIGTYMYQANYTYYFIYVVGDFKKLTIATLCSAVVGFVAAIIMPKFGAKLGKKWSVVVGFTTFGIGLMVLSMVAAKSWIYYIICMAITSFGMYTYIPFMVLIFMDTGEYYLWKTGKDTRSIAAGLASPPMKIGMFAGGTIGLALLGRTGFVAGGGFEVTQTWINSFMRVTFLYPAFVFIAAAIWMAIFYRISDADAARYAKENADRAKAAAGQQ